MASRKTEKPRKFLPQPGSVFRPPPWEAFFPSPWNACVPPPRPEFSPQLDVFVPLPKVVQDPATKAKQRPATKAERHPVLKAEQRPATKAERRPAIKAEQHPKTKAEQRPATKAKQRPAIKAERRAATKAEQHPATKADQHPSTKAEQHPATKAKQRSAVKAEQHSAPADCDTDYKRANISALINRFKPDDCKVRISMDAKDLINDCCTEFVHLISTEASKESKLNDMNTINPEHVITALGKLGFTDYKAGAEEAYDNFKTLEVKRRRLKAKLGKSGLPEEVLYQKQKELFEKVPKILWLIEHAVLINVAVQIIF